MHLLYVRSTMYSDFRNNYWIRQKIIYIYQTSKHVSTRLDLEFQCWCILNKTPFLEPTNILKIYRMQVCAEDDKCISCQYRTLWNEIHYISSATYFFLSVYYNISTIYIWNFDCTTKIDAQDFLYGRVNFHLKLLNVKCIWRISK